NTAITPRIKITTKNAKPIIAIVETPPVLSFEPVLVGDEVAVVVSDVEVVIGEIEVVVILVSGAPEQKSEIQLYR
ncbi:hypothetical protein HDV02_001090, partial [Globomyces sp. JEL0801]